MYENGSISLIISTIISRILPFPENYAIQLKFDSIRPIILAKWENVEKFENFTLCWPIRVCLEAMGTPYRSMAYFYYYKN